MKEILIGGAIHKDTFLTQNENTDILSHHLHIKNDDEFKHFGVFGASGAGKTVLLNNLFYQIRKRLNEKAIVHDFKQDFTDNHFNPFFDEIFNPVETQKSLRWTIFNDIKNKQDIDIIVNSLIPNSNANDPFWNNAGKNVFKALLRLLHFTHPNPKNADLWDLICMNDKNIHDKLLLCEETRFYASIFKDMQSKTTQSVMEVLKTHVECFEYMKDMDGDFSMRAWVKKGTGSIFVQNNKNVQDTIKPLITLFLDLASKFALAQKDQKTNKIWFFFDEIGELHRLDSIISLLTQGRSKAVISVVATQGHMNLKNIYSTEELSIILNAISNLFILEMNDDIECKYFANHIGPTKVKKRNVQYNSKGRQIGVNEHVEERLIVQPYEIKNAGERVVFCKSASDLNWTFVKVFPKRDWGKGIL
ncbi:type IV secretion system DNA-binding domain-containing protein [Arcobacter sp. FWKO B]|uniref:type IV secretion system DNA-binding domain-containing protein n=1 Tax=Arcobacter sp. FWKO B TaxID=2593672 RepID=UPI0018A48647|nr:type IV secretion system DNA-binding domain-containing protein [Arcobacter sp. FWKO B]QOG13049.1 hypothetical protein FWKOB_10265 [Arcobacter sp. FWKO B]